MRKTSPYIGTVKLPPKETVCATPSMFAVNDEFVSKVFDILPVLIDGEIVRAFGASNLNWSLSKNLILIVPIPVPPATRFKLAPSVSSSVATV